MIPAGVLTFTEQRQQTFKLAYSRSSLILSSARDAISPQAREASGPHSEPLTAGQLPCPSAGLSVQLSSQPSTPCKHLSPHTCELPLPQGRFPRSPLVKANSWASTLFRELPVPLTLARTVSPSPASSGRASRNPLLHALCPLGSSAEAPRQGWMRLGVYGVMAMKDPGRG